MHNHPSGDPTPSADDLALTARLVSAGAVLGIDVLDHIVIGDGRARSNPRCAGGPSHKADSVNQPRRNPVNGSYRPGDWVRVHPGMLGCM